LGFREEDAAPHYRNWDLECIELPTHMTEAALSCIKVCLARP
jgi:hypothetical protein